MFDISDKELVFASKGGEKSYALQLDIRHISYVSYYLKGVIQRGHTDHTAPKSRNIGELSRIFRVIFFKL